jgi:hypothetical protein
MSLHTLLPQTMTGHVTDGNEEYRQAYNSNIQTGLN